VHEGIGGVLSPDGHEGFHTYIAQGLVKPECCPVSASGQIFA
jgi:hypothetical protein